MRVSAFIFVPKTTKDTLTFTFFKIKFKYKSKK